MNKIDKLLDQIEAVYHTPAVGSIRMELADLRRERDSWQALSAAADADARAQRADNASLRVLMNWYNLGGWTDSERLMKERDAARAEVEELRALLRRALECGLDETTLAADDLAGEIDAFLAGKSKDAP